MLHALNTGLPFNVIRVNMKDYTTIRMSHVNFIIMKMSVNVCKTTEIENIT